MDGEYEAAVERADIALEPTWFPAVENRGEGIVLQLRGGAVMDWLGREPVHKRLSQLVDGHVAWARQRNSERHFPGGPYVLLHTLSHLLIQSLSMRCGYPAASIRERIYADYDGKRFALLLYTASPDAEGTLGGLVQGSAPAWNTTYDTHWSPRRCAPTIRSAPSTYRGQSMEERWLHGAACHGCALIAETSCEMRNEYLDRALVASALCAPEAGVLRRDDRRFVIAALLAVPPYVRSRLLSALESRQLVPAVLGGCRPLDGRRRPSGWDAAGAPGVGAHRRIAGGGSHLAEQSGARGGPSAGARLRPGTGPEVVGLHARDTRRVYEELIGSAQHSIWVCSYAFFDGPTAFATLAGRLDANPLLKVTLLLNIERRRGGHYRGGYPGAPLRGSLLGKGVARQDPSEGVLRPAFRRR